MLMSILPFNASIEEKENISLFCLYLELVPAREDRLWEASKKKCSGFFGGVPGFLGSTPSCDHFGRHGEWKNYLATKILAKVTNWRPTDSKKNLLEKLSKILDEFNQ